MNFTFKQKERKWGKFSEVEQGDLFQIEGYAGWYIRLKPASKKKGSPNAVCLNNDELFYFPPEARASKHKYQLEVRIGE